MTYDFKIKKFNKEDNAEKIEQLNKKKESAIEETKSKMDEERAQKVNALKAKFEAQKREVQQSSE